MTLQLRRAIATDADALHGILVACGLDLRDRLGLTHWVPAFPRDLFDAQVEKGNVWAAVLDGTPVGTFTVSEDPPSYVEVSLWSSEGEPALYATRIAVLPRHQRQGIGARLVSAVERLAGQARLRSVRFDALAAHELLLAYYERLGYREVGRYEAFGQQLAAFEKLL